MDSFDSLSDEPISRLGPLPNLSVAPSDSILDAVRLMREHRHGCVLVCAEGNPVGVITERDVLRRMGASLPLDGPVGEAVTGDVWSVRSSDSVLVALRMMNRHQCRHLVVLNEDGKSCGFLSVRRIVRELVEHFPATVYNLPPDSTKIQMEREGA